MSDQSDTDVDTSTKSDQCQATSPTSMLVDKVHSEIAQQNSAASKSFVFSDHQFVYSRHE